MRASILLIAAAATVFPVRATGGQEQSGTRRVDIGGFALAITCLSSGSPVVVVDGGAATWSVRYRHLQDPLAETTRVCTYDRAGLGESDPSPAPRTSENMVAELHALLAAAGEEGPYVLVGHSLGGYNVRLFAHRYPDEVAGVVLMESGHHEQFERLPDEVAAAIGAAGPQYRSMARMARQGELPPQPIPDLPAFASHPELVRTYEETVGRPTYLDAVAGEMENAPTSAAQAGRSGSLGDVPLVVVTAGNSFASYAALGIPVAAANETWLELQSELLELSTNSTQLMAPDATHQVERDAPELVLKAIRQVVAEVREGGREARGGGPDPEELRVLPPSSVPAVDELLDTVEAAYASMDVEAFVALFTDDFLQLDPNRRTRVAGKDAWREQTVRINAAHRSMGRRHFGRVWIEPWALVELEWWGTIRGEALGEGIEDKEYRYGGLGLIEIEEGRIKRQILWGDFATLQEQLWGGPTGRTSTSGAGSY